MPRIPDPPDDDLEERTERPVAVGGPPAGDGMETVHEPEADEGTWTFEGQMPGDLGPEAALDQSIAGAPEAIERPRDELYVGIACLVLAATVFLPWYKRSIAGGNISGWASGTWGPVIFFLALAGAAIVGLRRLRVQLAFPVDHSFVLEGIGWLAVAMAFIKRFFPPKFGTASYGINTFPMIMAMLAAVAVALLGGRVSSSASLVMRPGWFKDKAGKAGALVLGIAVLLGAGFGLATGGQSATPTGTAPLPKTTKGFPPCARTAGVPQPAGFTAIQGAETTTKQFQSCSVTFSTTLAPATAFARMQSALKTGKWKFTVPKTGTKLNLALVLSSPRCGSVNIIGAPVTKGKAQTSTAYVFLTPCPKK